jgi:hypothetical protein
MCCPERLLKRITELDQTFLKKVAPGILTLKFSPETPTSKPNPQRQHYEASQYGTNES